MTQCSSEDSGQRNESSMEGGGSLMSIQLVGWSTLWLRLILCWTSTSKFWFVLHGPSILLLRDSTNISATWAWSLISWLFWSRKKVWCWWSFVLFLIILCSFIGLYWSSLASSRCRAFCLSWYVLIWFLISVVRRLMTFLIFCFSATSVHKLSWRRICLLSFMIVTMCGGRGVPRIRLMGVAAVIAL